ncbi:hypothetical protein K461DRAFT_295553 [Myriangium duriaei CBS 260.36]|uniref:N-acetyltransferase domain-containing protein n=1 Tax=Myriangium duriaei CBS 260.36 TaxID=1168546 RepID=A0A9P4IX27_9PEZI|nr:hypothetical protein K461DRAFT_295553 [Myriangium duriaei CBS 260.36]
MASATTYSIVSNSHEGIAKTNAAIASAFTSAPISLALYVERNGLEPPYPQKLSRDVLEPYFWPQVENAVSAGAICIEAGDYSAVAIWGEPATTSQTPVTTTSGSSGKPLPMLLEFLEKVEDAKKHFLATTTMPDEHGNTPTQVTPLRPYYDLKFLARNPDVPRVSGAISAVVRPFLEKARTEGAVVWLEATGPAAVAVYTHFGFEVVERIVIGKGRVGVDGWPQENGEGVSIWAMIFK